MSNQIERLSVEIKHKVSDGDWYRLEIAKKCMKSVSNTKWLEFTSQIKNNTLHVDAIPFAMWFLHSTSSTYGSINVNVLVN